MNRSNILADSLAVSKRSLVVFSVFMALTGLSGLTLMPFRDVDIPYLTRLTFHVAVGLLNIIFLVGMALLHFKRVLGWQAAIGRLFLYAVIFLFFLVPFTGSLIMICTTLLLWIDWRLARRRLRRMHVPSDEISQARSLYLDYAVVLQLSMTGWLTYIGCLSFFLPIHRIHALTLPAAVLWFSVRHIRSLRLLPKTLATAGLVAFIAACGSLYYWKQILRNDETDVTYPDVYQTVESSASRHLLKPANPSMLQDSASCSGKACHTVLVDQWRGSAHRFSVNNRFFQKQVALFIEMEGTTYVRTCINCHDPATALLPDAEERYARGEIDNPEGVSCKACHTITAFDGTRGNGLYTIKAPFSYPFDGYPEGSVERSRHDAAIHADPRRHLRSYRRKTFYRSSDYCIACHLITVPEELTGGPVLRLHTLFDQWRGSKWEKATNCVDCHLPRMQMDVHGYSFFDHRIMGSNVDLALAADVPTSELPYVEDYTSFTKRYLAGDLAKGRYEVVAEPAAYTFRQNPRRQINPLLFFYPSEIMRYLYAASFLSRGPILNLEVTGLHIEKPGQRLKIHTRTTNVRVGHNFPSGPIDVQEVWLQAVLRNEAGQLIAQIGGVDHRHYVDPHAPILGSRGIQDSQGRQLLRHEFWKAASVIDRRVLGPFESVEDTLVLPIRPPVEGTYSLEIRWNFRRINQRIADWVWDNQGVTMPIVELDRSTLTFTIEKDPSNKGDYAIKVHNVSRPPRSLGNNFLEVLRGPRDE